MVLPIFFTDIYNRIKSKEFNSSIALKHLGLLVAFTIAALSVFGYLSIGSSVGTGGYSNYRFNLNSFVDSDTLWSNIMPDLNSIAMDYEGFAFLGIGIIALILIVGVDFVLNKKNFQKVLTSKLIFLLIPCFIMLIFSFTNKISLNETILFQYDIPLFLKPFTKIFRSAGRFCWPIYYYIFLMLFIIISQSKRKKFYLYLLPLLLCLQIYDTNDAAYMFRKKMSEPRYYWRNIGGDEKVYKDLQLYWETPLISEEWNQINKKYSSLISVYPQKRNDKAFPLALYAAKNSMSINFGYFSRYKKEEINKSISKINYELLDRNFDKKSVYIISDDKVWEDILKENQSIHLIKELDGFRIFAPYYFK